MNSQMIKAICHQIARDVGGHNVAAALAEVGASTWSDYANFDKPDCTIPLHRAVLIEEKTGTPYFTRALAEMTGDPGAATLAEPAPLAAAVLSALSGAMTRITEALADRKLTPNEQRALLADTQQLVDRAHKLNDCVAAAPTTDRLRAV